MIWEREGSTYIVLDGETLLTSRHETIPFEELKQYLPDAAEEKYPDAHQRQGRKNMSSPVRM